MDTADHLAELDRHAHRFADALARAADAGALARTVVTCPGWSVRDLAEHLGGLYRWSTHLVDAGVVRETWRRELPIEYPGADDEVAGWFADAVEPMIAAFAAAPPTRPVWAWGVDPHARFWPRRMLHESAVHLVDLRLTVDGVAPVAAAVAVDGIDEFLTNLPATARWGAPLDRLRGDGATLSVRPDDAAATWRLRFDATGLWWDRDDGEGDATLRGPVADLYLWLQGRDRPAVVATGRTDLVDRWRAALDF